MTTGIDKTTDMRTETAGGDVWHGVAIDPSWAGVLVATLRRLGGRVSFLRLLKQSCLDREILCAAVKSNKFAGSLVAHILRDRDDVASYIGKNGRVFEWLSDKRRAKIVADCEDERERDSDEKRTLEAGVKAAVEALGNGGFVVSWDETSMTFYAERDGLRFAVSVVGSVRRPGGAR